MACQFVNVLDVTVLPPYLPSAAEQCSPKLFSANVQAQSAAAMGVPAVEQGQRGFFARCKVRRRRSPAIAQAGVSVSWDGRRVTAPPGVNDTDGLMDLKPYLRKHD